MALGAARGDIVAMVLRGAFLQTGLGLLIGIPAALAGGRVLAHQLYGIQPRNPLMLGAATLLLAAYAFIAGLIPALRAAGVDPIRALRTEGCRSQGIRWLWSSPHNNSTARPGVRV